VTALLQSLRGLLAYTIWADRRILEALAGVPAEELTRENGSSFGSLLATMAHILGAEQVWLGRFLGSPLERLPSESDYPDLPSLAGGFTEFWPQLEFFMASLAGDQLDATVEWVNSRGEAFSAPQRTALLHFVNHSTYHRGQVATQMRQLGHAPPTTDLVYWRGGV